MDTHSSFETINEEQLQIRETADVTNAAHILGKTLGIQIDGAPSFMRTQEIPGLPKQQEGIPDNHDCTICAATAACGLFNKVQENGGNNPLMRRLKAVQELTKSDPDLMKGPDAEHLIREKMEALKLQAAEVAVTQTERPIPKKEVPKPAEVIKSESAQAAKDVSIKAPVQQTERITPQPDKAPSTPVVKPDLQVAASAFEDKTYPTIPFERPTHEMPPAADVTSVETGTSLPKEEINQAPPQPEYKPADVTVATIETSPQRYEPSAQTEAEVQNTKSELPERSGTSLITTEQISPKEDIPLVQPESNKPIDSRKIESQSGNRKQTHEPEQMPSVVQVFDTLPQPPSREGNLRAPIGRENPVTTGISESVKDNISPSDQKPVISNAQTQQVLTEAYPILEINHVELPIVSSQPKSETDLHVMESGFIMQPQPMSRASPDIPPVMAPEYTAGPTPKPVEQYDFAENQKSIDMPDSFSEAPSAILSLPYGEQVSHTLDNAIERTVPAPETDTIIPIQRSEYINLPEQTLEELPHDPHQIKAEQNTPMFIADQLTEQIEVIEQTDEQEHVFPNGSFDLVSVTVPDQQPEINNNTEYLAEQPKPTNLDEQTTEEPQQSETQELIIEDVSPKAETAQTAIVPEDSYVENEPQAIVSKEQTITIFAYEADTPSVSEIDDRINLSTQETQLSSEQQSIIDIPVLPLESLDLTKLVLFDDGAITEAEDLGNNRLETVRTDYSQHTPESLSEALPNTEISAVSYLEPFTLILDTEQEVVDQIFRGIEGRNYEEVPIGVFILPTAESSDDIQTSTQDVEHSIDESHSFEVITFVWTESFFEEISALSEAITEVLEELQIDEDDIDGLFTFLFDRRPDVADEELKNDTFGKHDDNVILLWYILKVFALFGQAMLYIKTDQFKPADMNSEPLKPRYLASRGRLAIPSG